VQFFLVMLVLCGAAALMVSPLYGKRGALAGDNAEEVALEAAKEAKFREIRDAELDFRTGKLSRDDYRALDSSLRSEAIDLLRRLDAVRGEEAPE
jgi:type II secretory pathway component PulM